MKGYFDPGLPADHQDIDEAPDDTELDEDGEPIIDEEDESDQFDEDK